MGMQRQASNYWYMQVGLGQRHRARRGVEGARTGAFRIMMAVWVGVSAGRGQGCKEAGRA